MIVELSKDYRFEAAHRLPNVPPGHRCARLHGHSYQVVLSITGPVDPGTGWLLDYDALDQAWQSLCGRLDHHNLGEIEGLENSTCENLCRYLWNALRPRIAQLSAVTVSETADSRCTYRGQ